MTRNDLLARLDGTEWTDFEIKSAAGGVSQDAFKTIAAMANSGGGWIVFGVSEQDGEYNITSIDDIDRFQNDLLSAIRTGDSFISPEQMRSGGYNDLRNPLIARVLRQAGLAEQAGMGLPMILETWVTVGRPEPEIHNDAGSKRFEIGFPWGPRAEAHEGVNEGVDGGVNGGVYGGVNGGVSEPVNEPVSSEEDSAGRVNDPVGEPVNEPVKRTPADSADLSTRARELLDIIAANPGLRSPELIEKTGASRATVRRALQELETAGRVVFRGAPKTGGYYLISGEEE